MSMIKIKHRYNRNHLRRRVKNGRVVYQLSPDLRAHIARKQAAKKEQSP